VDSGQPCATLTPEWGRPSTTDASLDVPSGLVVIRWDALVDAPTLRWDAGDHWTFAHDSLLQLSISLASSSLAAPAEAQYTHGRGQPRVKSTHVALDPSGITYASRSVVNPPETV
jgi:hypothetical protein